MPNNMRRQTELGRRTDLALASAVRRNWFPAMAQRRARYRGGHPLFSTMFPSFSDRGSTGGS